ncbi:protein GLE1-like isoform X2 [Triticum dicoccoides]|uniref:protein GLE1-like isoform X2 n=1 Tax=Triticum dicoccoides TaxID=85692 RepID=UPI00188FF6E6|nr:protein GLE1-like isoform X2 [Triticum dicoccoides]
MAFAGLELRYPRALDPHPNWTLGDALTDATRRSAPPTPLKQPPEWASGGDMREKAFVMRVEEEDGSEEEDDNTDEDAHALVTTGARFPCNDLECSGFEDSGDEVDCSSAPYHLMEKRSLEKSILLVLELEHHLKIQEEVRSKLSSLELCHQNEIQRTISAFARLQKYAESRKEIDRRLDVQFQRKIAEVLDKHLSMVQRDHGQKSQIVERRIRDDAAVEEAKREQSMKEEKVNQERTRKEAEARQKAAGKLAAEAQKAAYEGAAILRVETVSTSSQISQNSVSHATMVNNIGVKSELPGIKVFADSIALEAELRRRALHDQVSSNIYLSKEYSQYGRQIGNSIGKLTPTTDSVKARASELIEALDGQDCPHPIACRLFADKMISIVKSRNTKDKTFGPLAFACGYVMLLVTNQVPDAMDYLLAEFHKVCMYTVPKHLHALNAQARNSDYYRLIGYQEEVEKSQSTESYLVNVVAYVKLYAAMIQTEIKGVRHPHGLAEGWKWLAMFLNTLPAITATAFALHAFLKMAGFALHKKYGSQFMKILDVISRRFIPALKEQGMKVQAEAISNLQNYLKDKVYLEEPEGRYLAQHLLSKVFMCEDQHRMATSAPVSSRE